MNNSLMCHVVAGYPSATECLSLIIGLQSCQVTAIEVQIPFSDPIADGEVIMKANDIALAQGITTESSFELISMARNQGVSTDIYLMSYIQKLNHFGMEAFCQQAERCGVKGLIIPDLPYDSPDYTHLSSLAATYHLCLVPVLSPGMSSDRLNAILHFDHPVIYVTSTRGITGNAYAPKTQLNKLVAHIKKHSSSLVMIGFGIASSQDVTNALEIGDVAVIGSEIIKQVEATNIDQTLKFVKSLVVK